MTVRTRAASMTALPAWTPTIRASIGQRPSVKLAALSTATWTWAIMAMPVMCTGCTIAPPSLWRTWRKAPATSMPTTPTIQRPSRAVLTAASATAPTTPRKAAWSVTTCSGRSCRSWHTSGLSSRTLVPFAAMKRNPIRRQNPSSRTTTAKRTVNPTP